MHVQELGDRCSQLDLFPSPPLDRNVFLSLLFDGKITQAIDLQRRSAPVHVDDLVQKAYRHYFETFWSINNVERLFMATRVPLGVDSEYLQNEFRHWYGFSLPELLSLPLEALERGDYESAVQGLVEVTQPEYIRNNYRRFLKRGDDESAEESVEDYFATEYDFPASIKDYDTLEKHLYAYDFSTTELGSSATEGLYSRFARNNDLRSIVLLYRDTDTPFSVEAERLLKDYITWCLSDPTKESIEALQSLNSDLYGLYGGAISDKDDVKRIISNATERLVQIGVNPQELKQELFGVEESV